MADTIEKLLAEISSQLERIEENQETLRTEVREGQERLEEAIANLSLPGSNYGIVEYQD